MRIGILSSLGHQTYQGKYEEKKEIWSPFWNLAMFHDNIPIDVVDYYQLKNNPNCDITAFQNRHIYTNGILLFNRLRPFAEYIFLYNSLDDYTSIDDIDIIIISTNYVFANWENNLISLLQYLNARNIKSIIGGIGIKKLFSNNRELFNQIQNLTNGYLILSDNGLSKLTWAIENISEVENKVIICDDKYEIKKGDFSMSFIDSKYHSAHTTLLTQTGCVFNCAFCSYKEKYKKHSFYDLTEIEKSLLTLNSTNENQLKHIRVVDETFNIDERRAIDFCNLLISHDFNFHWSCFLRGDRITKELVEALHNSKCDLVSIGVESGSPFMQEMINKNLDLSHLKESIQMLKSKGIKVNISLLVGFFGESEATINETISFIKEGKPDFARINLWYPSKNTHNKTLFQDYQFETHDNTWSHKTLNEKQAVEYSKKIYLADSETIFLPPFSSIFDQWPVLASYGLSADEIVCVFGEYYGVSKSKSKNDES